MRHARPTASTSSVSLIGSQRLGCGGKEMKASGRHWLEDSMEPVLLPTPVNLGISVPVSI